MDDKDRQIVDLIQTRFPIDPRPYQEIGQRVDLPEDEVIARIHALKKANIIRRVGGLMEPRKIGYVSSLIAAKVDPDRLDEVVEAINGYVGVTHNYHREHEYNVWFTLIAKDAPTHTRILNTLRALPGVTDLHSLPATRVFKLKVNFQAGEDDDAETE